MVPGALSLKLRVTQKNGTTPELGLLPCVCGSPLSGSKYIEDTEKPSQLHNNLPSSSACGEINTNKILKVQKTNIFPQKRERGNIYLGKVLISGCPTAI